MQRNFRFVALTTIVKTFAFRLAPVVALLPFASPASMAHQAPESVTIHVRADPSNGPSQPIWSYWGYDEPNYTYAPNGKKLLGELAALSPGEARCADRV